MRLVLSGKNVAILTVACLIFIGGLALAQQPRANPIREIANVDYDLKESPEYDSGNYDVEPGEKEWFMIRVGYETEPEWVDELQFVYYVYFKSNMRKTPKMLFKHTVSYVDIKEGRHLSKIYIHPNTYERYVDDVVYVGVEIRYKGRPVAWSSTPSKVRDSQWWEKAQNVMSPVTGKMMDRSETPFAFINPDMYEQTKRGSD